MLGDAIRGFGQTRRVSSVLTVRRASCSQSKFGRTDHLSPLITTEGAAPIGAIDQETANAARAHFSGEDGGHGAETSPIPSVRTSM
jgi:hypothetical protein